MVKKNISRGRQPKRTPRFGPVAAVNTAPVAIGNSIRGSKARVLNTGNGCRVVGRDFAFSLASTASTVVGWTLVGGMPLTPAVMPSSVLRSYTQMYSKFKINKINVHYITSSPTSQAGDVLFYYERDRRGPMVDFTNNSFLPYVLSDPNTVIGPQWTNHTLAIKPTDEFNMTDYGLHTDLNEDSCGSIFLFSKTNATNSPGYILIDYDISFRELCVNPRAGILPISRGQFSNVTFGVSTLAVTSGSTSFNMGITGKDLSNTSSTMIQSAAVGDIYKVIFDVTNSQLLNTWTNCTAANLLAYQTPSASTAVTLDDGFTCYAIYSNSSLFFYPTLEAAYSNSQQFRYGITATVTFAITAWLSLVGFSSSSEQASY